MTDKKSKNTTKETKDSNQNDFLVVMEGKLKGRKELLKEKQTKDRSTTAINNAEDASLSISFILPPCIILAAG